MPKPRLDIILPTRNNLSELRASLAGFAEQSDQSLRVLVCVDGSDDGTIEFLASTRFPFECLMLQHPDKGHHGRNATRNLALPHLSADFLLLLDSDCVPSPDLIQRHLEWLTENDGVSLGIIRYTNLRSNAWARYTHTRGRYHLPDKALLPYHLFNTGNAAMRTRYFVELGGQDASMSHYGGGDTEFSIRLWERYRLPYSNNKAAQATSVMNKTVDEALEQMVEFGRYNLRYLYDRHPAHRHLYAMDLMAGNTFYSRLYRLIMQDWLAKGCRGLMSWTPSAVQVILIRYLMLYKVLRGFRAGAGS